jgi:3-methyl-2-oxobutanoate hydroxymethyltransferase
VRSAVRYLSEAGAAAVKLEGGAIVEDRIRAMVRAQIPVMAHIGLTPQSVHALGGYRVQGRGEEGAARMKREAVALEQAGAALIVLEMVPAQLAGEITGLLKVCATIGIGAGLACDGQVLVLHDMLGVYPGKKGRFVRNFMEGATSIDEAVTAYVKAVKDGSFPAPEHTY